MKNKSQMLSAKVVIKSVICHVSSPEKHGRRYDEAVDKAILLYFIEQYAALPKDERVAEVDKVGQLTVLINKNSKPADDMYAKSVLADESKRLWMADLDLAQLKQRRSIHSVCACNLAVTKDIEDAKKELAGKQQAARPALMEAIIAYRQLRSQFMPYAPCV